MPLRGNSPEAYGMRRHCNLYFDDGNIILLVEGTCFRVHSSQLARHSDVFSGMMSIPQPINPFMIDGCAVVEMQDKMEDMAHLLTAVYDGLYFAEGTGIDFPSLSAVLRLSTKYFFGCLRRRAIARLQLDWPTTLAEWDARELRATTSDRLYNPSTMRTNPILIINLARELSIPSLLPAAFYDLSRYPSSQILGGSPDLAGFPKAYLDAIDLINVYQGKEAGQQFISSIIVTELEDRGTAEWCHNSRNSDNEICRDAFGVILFETLRGMGGLTMERENDPLFTLQRVLEMQKRETPFDVAEKVTARGCEACRAELRVATERARQQVWENLPAWFGLGDPVNEEYT